MRKLIFGINITLDGCCDHTKGEANEDVHEYFTEMFKEADTLVYGRKTYELMVPYWPDTAKNNSAETKSVNDFAKAFDAIDKIVVISGSLDKTAYENTTIVHTNMQNEILKQEILKLKQEEGKNILTGGVDVPTQLIQLGLVDEYHFMVHPIIAGEGRRLFEGVNMPEQLKLKLADSKVFKSGYAALRYVNN